MILKKIQKGKAVKNKDKENTKDKKKYDMNYDYLAVPEIHTKNVKKTEKEDVIENITYDSVAIPEIHMHKNE